MFPKIRQVMKETFNAKKASEELGARIDASRGYGTYDPLAGSQRKSPPGFPAVTNTRENYERKSRSSARIAKQQGTTDTMKNINQFPGIGQ